MLRFSGVLSRSAARIMAYSKPQTFAIATHDGKFHCDEVLACCMLKQLPEYADATVMRTRNPDLLKTCAIVVDVGGVYDPRTLRFDHHQKGFTETMRTLSGLDFDTKLSSAGLVYYHFGRRVIAAILRLDSSENPIVGAIFAKLYETFIHSVDAIDNGISQYDGTPRYKQISTLDARVARMNPAWNSSAQGDVCFVRAMSIVGDEFHTYVKYLYEAWLPARQFVVDAINEREKHHPSGKIVAFKSTALPWKDHLFTVEKEKKLQSADMTFVIFPNDDTWRVQAIPVDEFSSFENRGPLPEAWRALRDAELSMVAGVPDCVFVHASGFIGGNKTFEGALKMAEKALIHLQKWNA